MLQITDLSLRIAGRLLLDHANLTLPEGTHAGLVGRNGTGKTTLFRAITGDLASETGSTSLPRNMKIGQVAQEAPATEQSLLEIVLEADTERSSLLYEADHATDPDRISEIHIRLADIDAHSAEARAGAILSGLGFDPAAQQRPASSFSGGWRMRVALAAVLFAQPDLLLLDEPTNYLDLEGTLWLESYVAKYPHTVLMISHDRDLLNKAVNSIVHLENQKLTFYRGGYDQFERQRAEALELQGKAQVKQAAKRAHMEAFVARFRAKASKAKQAQSRLKMLERLKPIASVIEDNVAPFGLPGPVKEAASPIIAMYDVSTGYEAHKPILRHLDLRIDHDDRIALLGANGNGKSTFAKLIAGRLKNFGGSSTIAPNLKVAFFAQHQLDDLRPEENAIQHVRRLMADAPEAKVRGRVAQMGLATAKMMTPAKDLSGGEKARLLMGLATFEGPNLLILDEPTNHLDIDSREALVEALNDFPGAVILISHDPHLIESTVDRLWLVHDGTVKDFDGDLDEYKALVLNGTISGTTGQRDKREEQQPKVNKAEARKIAAQRRIEYAPLAKKIKEAEEIVAKLQQKIQGIEAEFGNPGNSPDHVRKLGMDKTDAQNRLAMAEENWLMLSGEYEMKMSA
jgi:ATP-binding cassette, subfamily F, member 3